ncbi:MAG: hypothetical protein CK424_00840 [Legionella sp.]|nr:MAG: hypothetical protein CK424_00840 [Legionella sp.]
MAVSLGEYFIEKLGHWFLQEEPPERGYLCDFNRLCHKIRPADVILVEGRSRASRIIKRVTQSSWSHAALYIGCLQDIQDIPYTNEF